MTDEIERVREERLVYEAVQAAHKEAAATGQNPFLTPHFVAALAKRLQPKPVPAPRVWSVSDKTVLKLRDQIKMRFGGQPTSYDLNAIVDDIIRDRPDAVAKDYQRRYRAAFGVEPSLKNLFPEVEG